MDANDRIFFVNVGDRNPAQFLWNVYVTDGDLTGEIAIGVLLNFANDPDLLADIADASINPFGGATASIRAQHAQSGVTIFPEPEGSGGAFIGALSQDLPMVTDEDRIPYPQQPVPPDIDFGTLPSDVTTLNSGLVVDDGNDLGRFLLGGTIIGAVDARRNLGDFYAGAVWTGDAGGQSEGPPEVEDNFKVAGDLRNLISLDSIGTDDATSQAPDYLTGFDLQVGGRVGQVRTNQSWYGHAEVNHLEEAPRIELAQRELENRNNALGTGFEDFNLLGRNPGSPVPNDPFFFNDSFDQAQYLGSMYNRELDRDNVVRVTGTLQKTPTLQDNADYYAVSLLAGQTVSVRVRENLLTFPDTITDTDGDGDIDTDDFNVIGGAEDPNPSGIINLGVFDPDGRLIATDYNNVDLRETQQQYLTFTADRPGVYRFAVASNGDAPEFGTGAGILATTPYTLTVLNVGDMAMGGLVAQQTIFDLADFSAGAFGIELFRGDLGVIKSIGGDFISNSIQTVKVTNGNLRALDAAGNLGGLSADDIILECPEGHVGLLRAGGALLAINRLVSPSLIRPIGGDYQLIDGPNATVNVNLKTNRAIGVIRAADMATGIASSLEVNADETGDDGVIDLIDVTGNFGALGPGGPQITTNGGNVRYIRVGGEVSQDTFFASNEGGVTPIDPGVSRTITDDSGSQITFRATGQVTTNPFFDPQFPQAGIDEFIGPGMNLLTYGIRGSGGVVVIDAVSDSGMEISVSGARSAEIGRVEIRGIGPEVVSGTRNSDGTIARGDTVPDDSSPTGSRTNYLLDNGEVTATTDPNAPPITGTRRRPEDMFVRISGSSVVDILNVVVIDTGSDTTSTDNANSTALDADGAVAFEAPGDPTAPGNALSIINTTGGEIVNVEAESVGELVSRGNLGMARSATGTTVEGIANLTAGGLDLGVTQPYLGIKEGITISSGNVLSMRAGKAIGNVAVIDGSIGELVANDGGEDDPNQFEGINGTVYVDFTDVPDDLLYLPGRILRVRIGEGILPTGSGAFAHAGIVVGSIVGPVTGNNADIRGDIIVNNRYRLTQTLTVVGPGGVERQALSPSNTPIESISLIDGSIINADIAVTGSPGDHVEFFLGSLSEFGDTFTRPEFEILKISTRGNGGIIGANIAAADVGTISATGGGFGIFSSNLDALTDGVFSRIETDGYGLRDVVIDTGSLGEIVTNGDGTSLSTNAINPRLRFSEVAESDPQLGPLDPFFGFESNALTDIHAFLGTSAVQPEISGVTDTGIIEQVDADGQRDLRTVRAWQIRKQSRLDFANSVGTLNVRDVINGLELTTGKLKSFSLAQDAFALTISVSGRVKKIDIKGSLAANSVIRTFGDGGQFDTVNVRGNLIGNINSSRSIKTITIGGDFTGNVSVNSGGTAIKTMKVGGTFIGGSLDIVGNVGTIQTAGSLGSLGDTLSVNGNINKIQVGGDLRSNVRVTGNLKNLTVKGSIVDGGIEDGLVIDVSNNLNSLNVGGDIQQGVQINARSIRKQRIGGQNLGEINIVA